MKIEDFITKKALTPADLFGEWKQKGAEDFNDPKAGELAAEKLTWMRIRVKRAIKAKELNIPAGSKCTFMRGKVPQAKVGEVMTVYSAAGKLLYTVIAGGGTFTVNAGEGAANIPTAEKKNGRKGKSAKAEKENRTPKEIYESTPIELRTGWYNYDLMDEINARLAEEGVKYWNEHDGKFPKRKMRRPRK